MFAGAVAVGSTTGLVAGPWLVRLGVAVPTRLGAGVDARAEARVLDAVESAANVEDERDNRGPADMLEGAVDPGRVYAHSWLPKRHDVGSNKEVQCFIPRLMDKLRRRLGSLVAFSAAAAGALNGVEPRFVRLVLDSGPMGKQ